MKLNEKYKISPEFDSLFKFDSKEDEIEHETKMLMFRFFSEFENLLPEKPIIKKDVAASIGTSPSFITQLYQGDKIVSLNTLAKLQLAYNFIFEIKAVSNIAYSSVCFENSDYSPKQRFQKKDEHGFWVFINNKPDYEKNDNPSKVKEYSLKVA